MGAAEVEWFLTRLAVEGQVSASTQNQVLAALLFLYREVLGIDLPWMSNIRRAKRPERLPKVLSRAEVKGLLAQLDGTVSSMVRLLYGSGLRLMECLRLRVQDIRSQRNEPLIRHGKGDKDWVTMLPPVLAEPIRKQIIRVRLLHDEDLAAGFGRVSLPDALARKYPNASRELAWQDLFQSTCVVACRRRSAAA
jgi:integrase